MGKIAFCFPGQGALEAGMGRELAEAVPAAMEVYRVGSEASGLDLQKLCFDSPLDDLVETEVQQPALVATCLAMLAAILGLEDEAVETLCRQILGVWPANYNCPGQIVISGENDAVEECCAEAESLGARRAIKLKVSGAFHSPLVGNAGKRLKPAIDLVRFHEPIAPFMSTVTAKIEPATRLGSLLVTQLTAPVRFTQAARELVHDGVTTFVEVGPGNVLSGLVKRIDRGVRTFSVNDLASLEKAREALSS